MNRAADAAVAVLATSQHGLFSRSQAVEAGHSEDTVRARLTSGLWVPVAHSVYSLPGFRPSFKRAAMAGVLDNRDSVASHQTAAQLGGMWVPPTTGIVVAVPHAEHHASSLARVRQLTDLRERDRTVFDGVPSTTPVRTVVDLAAVLRIGAMGRVLEEAARTGKAPFAEVRRCLEELARRGKPGVRMLRMLLDERGPGYVVPESQLERALFRVLDRPGRPKPVRQYPLPWRSPVPGRVDAAYPFGTLIVEGDSRKWHTRLDDFERDRERDNEAQAAGWAVLRFTYHHITRDPDDLWRLVDATLRSRAA